MVIRGFPYLHAREPLSHLNFFKELEPDVLRPRMFNDSASLPSYHFIVFSGYGSHCPQRARRFWPHRPSHYVAEPDRLALSSIEPYKGGGMDEKGQSRCQ